MFLIEGLVKFADAGASENIKRVDAAVAALKDRGDKLGPGLTQIASGLTALGASASLATAGLGIVVSKAAAYQQAMADINAVNNFTATQFQQVGNLALRLGTETSFGATDAARGMEILTKAGLSTRQTMEAIPGVLAGAAAEGIGLAQASEIIIGITQGLNLGFANTTMVADKLSMAANASAAGMTDLGEAFKYAGTLTQQGIMTFDELTATLAALSNAGLKGSIAGTSLIAMFNQITKPSEAVLQAFGGQARFIKIFTDEAGKLRKIPELIDTISRAANSQGNELQKLGFLTDFVGVEGAKAFAKIQAQIMAKDEQGRPIWQGLLEDIAGADGAAKMMADKRLDSLNGALTKLKNRVEVAAIAFGMNLAPDVQTAVLHLADFAMVVANAMTGLNTPVFERTGDQFRALNTNVGHFVEGFVMGFRSMIKSAKETFGGLSEYIQKFLPEGTNTYETMGKITAGFIATAAVLGPLLLGMAALTFAAGTAVNTMQGFYQVFSFFVPAATQTSLLSGALTKMAQAAVFTGGKLRQVLGPAVASMASGLRTILAPALAAATAALRGVGAALLTLLANPIVQVILVIAALGAAAYGLWKNWDAVKGFLVGIWDTIVASVTTAVTWINNQWDSMSNTAKFAILVIGTVLTGGLLPLFLIIARNWDTIVGGLSAGWSFVVDIFQWGVNEIKMWWGNLSQETKDKVERIANTLTFGLIPVIKLVYNEWDHVTGFMKSAWQGVADFMGRINWAALIAAPIQAAAKPLAALLSILTELPGADIALATFGIQAQGLRDELKQLTTIGPLLAPAPGGPQTITNPQTAPLPNNVIGVDFASGRRAATADTAGVGGVKTDRLQQSALDQQGLRFGTDDREQGPINISVMPAPVTADLTTTIQLDGREVAKSVSQHQMNNTERNGDTVDPVARRKIKTHGGFILPVGQ